MNATTQNYRCLDLKKISRRKHQVISTETALKEVTPISWSNAVRSGIKKVNITKDK